MNIPDNQYLQLYGLLVRLMEEHPAGEEKRVVFYLPDLFISMAQEIMKLNRRIDEQMNMELHYRGLQLENMSLRDDIRDLKKELKRVSKQ